MSKISAVEKDLKANGSITNWDIVTRYYSTNPQKIIEKLRKNTALMQYLINGKVKRL